MPLCTLNDKHNLGFPNGCHLTDYGMYPKIITARVHMHTCPSRIHSFMYSPPVVQCTRIIPTVRSPVMYPGKVFIRRHMTKSTICCIVVDVYCQHFFTVWDASFSPQVFILYVVYAWIMPLCTAVNGEVKQNLQHTNLIALCIL